MQHKAESKVMVTKVDRIFHQIDIISSFTEVLAILLLFFPLA
jgi:hypothetical protein